MIAAGFRVSGVARTYDEAMRLANHTPINVAVVDVQLAGQPDGVAFARALLRQRWLPLIFLTGTTDEATFERAKAVHPAAFLNKPFRPIELVQQVRLALHNSQPGEAAAPVSPIGADPVYLPTEQGYVRVLQTDIYYLEAARNFTNIFLTQEAMHRLSPDNRTGKSLTLTGNLGYWSTHLSPKLFYRLSKSLLVNLSHVDRIEAYQVAVGNRLISLPTGTRKALIDQLHVIRTR